jgi:hypothetical protein
VEAGCSVEEMPGGVGEALSSLDGSCRLPGRRKVYESEAWFGRDSGERGSVRGGRYTRARRGLAVTAANAAACVGHAAGATGTAAVVSLLWLLQVVPPVLLLLPLPLVVTATNAAACVGLNTRRPSWRVH